MVPRDNPESSDENINASPDQPDEGFRSERMARQTAPSELEDPKKRALWGLGDDEGDRGPYLIELNVQYVDGLAEAAKTFAELFHRVIVEPARGHGGVSSGDDPWGLTRISKTYIRCEMSLSEWKRLIAADEREARTPQDPASLSVEASRLRTIYKLWPDFPVQAQLTHSISTIKADAALRTFEASGEGIIWAVIDSGIDGEHLHFGSSTDHVLHDPAVQGLHRCFIPIDGQRLQDPDQELLDGEDSRTPSAKSRSRCTVSTHWSTIWVTGHTWPVSSPATRQQMVHPSS